MAHRGLDPSYRSRPGHVRRPRQTRRTRPTSVVARTQPVGSSVNISFPKLPTFPRVTGSLATRRLHNIKRSRER